MHRGITAIEEYLDEGNLDVLSGATFVFLASGNAVGKPVIMDWLEARDVPFIDVGIGHRGDRRPTRGLLRSRPACKDTRAGAPTIPVPAPERDDYGRNIQTADLNALNGLLAVIRWKRHTAIYPAVTSEGFTTYSLTANEIANEDLLP